jgi:hypothetical protein
MAIYYGPDPIITNGLVFAIDADNTRCYPGTGTSIDSITNITNTQTGSMTDLTWVDKSGTAKGKSFYWGETSNEGMQINNTDQLATAAQMTIEVWFNIDTSVSHDIVLLVGDEGDSGVNMKLTLDRIYIYNSDNASTGVYKTSAFSTGVWTHMAVCIDGATTGDQKFYTNGVEQSFLNNSNSGANFGKPSSNPIYIGKDHTGSDNFDGYISEVRTYNRVLTEAEILHNFNSQRSKYGI